METIGLIAAMTQESQALLRIVKRSQRASISHFRCYSFDLPGQRCVLVTSGMGVRRASQAARALVEICSPQRLISFGIAGAVESDLEIGDVVLPESFCHLENEMPGALSPLAHWSAAAQVAAAHELSEHGAKVYIGTAITTDGSQVTKDQLGDLAHPVLEMETAGIAQVAAEKGIPVLSLRAISDGPRAPIPVDLGEIMDDDANLRIDRLLNAVLRNPRVILQSRQMMQNSRIAEHHAALALLAALLQGAS
jgi:adenosylhomocysteine nucleosidase